MTLWSVEAGAWLAPALQALQQLQSVAADTVLVRQVGEDPSAFQKISGIASGLVSIALLVLTAFLVPAAWNFRKSYKKISDLLDKVYADIHPITKHLSSAADNLDYISTSIRVDIQTVNQTVAAASERVHRALEASERRVKEMNALLEVVQEEAENTFVSTAAALRGVREGARVMRGEPRLDTATRHAIRERLDEPLDDALDDDLDDDDRLDVDFDDGNDSQDTQQRTSPGPRIRPRHPGGAS
jgi:uncharacterized protein YoxC